MEPKLIHIVSRGDDYYPSKGGAGDFLRAFTDAHAAHVFASGVQAAISSTEWCMVETFNTETLTYEGASILYNPDA